MCTCSMHNFSDGGDGNDDDVDRISDLPEESILIRLPSTAAAARTCVLSRRWRHVWTRLQALSFVWNHKKPGAIATAFAAYSAPTLNRLAISAGGHLYFFTIAPWLRFASERVAGNLALSFSRFYDRLDLPVSEKATSINIHVPHHLRLPAAGSFARLTAVTIISARMEDGDFEALCSPRCPRLQRFKVRRVKLVDAAADVSIRSDSLERLIFLVNGVRRLEVVAPMLRYFRAAPKTDGDDVPAAEPGILDANIAAPMLEDVAWYGVFDLHRQRFAEAGRCLQKLTVVGLPTTALMRRFYIVDELVLNFGISPTTMRRHAFPSAALHLLRKSAGVTKLLIRLPWMGSKNCTEGCPCFLPDSCITDNVQLDSLKEVEILGFRGEALQLKKVYIKISMDVKSINKKTRKKICKIIDGHPDIDIEFNLRS